MNRTLALLALASLPFLAWGQDNAADSAERARIAGERKKAESEFLAQEKACYAKFAVNDCLAKARVQRRTALADLKRQEVALSDAQRRRRAADHVRELDERTSQEKQREAAERKEKALAQQRGRDERAAQKAADHAAQAASAPARAARHGDQEQRREADVSQSEGHRAQEAADNARRAAKKASDAEEHKANLAKRLAERKKPPASALPVPP